MSSAITGLEQLRDNLLAECAEDYVGLWSILWHFHHDYHVADPAERRRLTLQLVRELLDTGVQAGDLQADAATFVPWKLSTDEVLARIEAGWDALGREPNLWEIVWFTTTDREARPVPRSAP